MATALPNHNASQRDALTLPECECSSVQGKVRGRDRKKVDVGREPNRQGAAPAEPICRETEHFPVLCFAAHPYKPRFVEVIVGSARPVCLRVEPGLPCVDGRLPKAWTSFETRPGSCGAPVGEVSSRRSCPARIFEIRQANDFACPVLGDPLMTFDLAISFFQFPVGHHGANGGIRQGRMSTYRGRVIHNLDREKK